MALSLTDQLTAQFYEWEKSGRGWYVFENPVDLEPMFEPFFFHGVPSNQIDDGKRHTLLSFIADSIRTAFTPASKTTPEASSEPAPPEAYQFVADAPLQALIVVFPQDFKLTGAETEQFVTMLSYSQYPISFEIIANKNRVRFQLVCRAPDVLHVVGQLKAYFPHCIIQEGTDNDLYIFNNQPGVVSDFGLKEEFTRPIAMIEKVAIDPLLGLFGILEHLREHDQVVLQILFKGTVNAWAESIIRSVTDQKGESFFLDAPEMPKMAIQKVSAPLYAVVIRVLVQSASIESANNIAERVGNTIMHVSRSEGNRLIPLTSNGYLDVKHQQDIIFRESHRQGMLLNGSELASFIRFPTDSVVSAKLEREIRKTKSAPAFTEGYQYTLGDNIHQGKTKSVSVSNSQRLRHTHIIGATGTGKSTLLLNLIVQDIEQGQGLAVLDPHGDLIENILPYIPANRVEDVILVDPADASFPIGFNILSAHSEIEKEILSSDLVAVFRRLSTSWGDQMNSVFANAILAFLESRQSGTLIDLRRFLVEKSFRDAYLKTVQDPNIVYFWQKEFPLLKTGSIGPILTRLDTFLRPKLIRNMVAQKRGLNFEKILDTKQILLVKLAQGLIGNENSYLLGTFFVSKIYQAAMARQAVSKEDRSDFFLYIDEFQNFITPSMSSILSGARKYHLGLILAHQDMQQLVKQESELASSVISNAGTRICFRIGDIDAKRFEDGFSFFEAQDLQNLNTGEAIVRIDRPEYDFTIVTKQLSQPDGTFATVAPNIIITRSHQKYGTPREEVEAELEILRGEQREPETKEQTDVVNLKQELPKQEQKQFTKIPAKDVTQSIEIQDSNTTEKLVNQKELTQHRYLQTLIKRMAESRGYKANIEEPTPTGNGLVDVSLERNGKKIACEIGVTTTKEWEIHNIEKCLAAGYELVVAIAADKKAMEKMQKQVEQKLNTSLQAKVLVMEPETFFLYLDKEIAKQASTETRIKGYRVKVDYDAISEEEMQKKRDSISKVVLDSLKQKDK